MCPWPAARPAQLSRRPAEAPGWLETVEFQGPVAPPPREATLSPRCHWLPLPRHGTGRILCARPAPPSSRCAVKRGKRRGVRGGGPRALSGSGRACSVTANLPLALTSPPSLLTSSQTQRVSSAAGFSCSEHVLASSRLRLSPGAASYLPDLGCVTCRSLGLGVGPHASVGGIAFQKAAKTRGQAPGFRSEAAGVRILAL